MASKTLAEIMVDANVEPINESMPKVKTFSELSPKRKKFCELLLEGVSITDAVFRAGYYMNRKIDDPKIRKRAYELGYKMMKEPIIRDFITVNAKAPIVRTGKIDEKAIVDRLTLIAMGHVEVKTTYKGKEYYSPPPFRDQVAAMKVLMEIKKMQNKEVPTEKRVDVMTGRVDKLVESIKTSMPEEVLEGEEV